MTFYEIDNIKSILEKILIIFSQSTELSTAILDNNGRVISKWYHPTTNNSLNYNDAYLKEKYDLHELFEKNKSYKISLANHYIQPSKLIDISIPIFIEKNIAGFIICVQIPIKNVYSDNTILTNNTELLELLNLINKKQKVQIKYCCELLQFLLEKHLPQNFNNLTLINTTNVQQESIEEKILQSANLIIDKSKNVNPNISKAIKFIDKNLVKDVHLKTVADYVFLNSDYFSRLFKKETGVSFIDYVNHRKIERSLVMLHDKHRTLDSISEELGYSQTSYYCKVFKNKIGCSPTDYRKKLNNTEKSI